jgi:rubrerythrin
MFMRKAKQTEHASKRGHRMENKIKAITVALDNELQERNFYLTQSKKTTNPVGKTMFLKIAADEEEHYRRLQNIHRELSRQGKWPDTVSNSVGTSNVLDTLRQIVCLAGKTPEASRDDIEALNIAIQFEAKGHSFYTELGNTAETAAEKEFFKLLASVEWEHLLSLKDTMLFYESPADWLAKTEKPQLEG